jgi:hypothetical protein
MMPSRTLGSIACILVALAQLEVAAQRAASNPPDITGAYERFGNIFGPRTEAQQKDPTIPPPSPPPPLKPEYLKQWQARVQAAREAEAKGQPLATGYTHCLPDGMPSMMAAMFPIEFLQSRGQVTVIEEAFTQIRRILLDRPQKAIDDVEPGFYGRSVGRWDGDTLVVDTVGIKEEVRYQNAPHSKELRIKERIRLVAPNILWNEITMEDPVTLEKPWTVTYAYRRMPDYTLLEYICEDNREYADEQGLQKIRIEPPAR